MIAGTKTAESPREGVSTLMVAVEGVGMVIMAGHCDGDVRWYETP